MEEHPHPSGLTEAELWIRYRRYPMLLAKFLLFGLIAYGLFRVVGAVQAVLFPVLLSMLIAYLLDPVVDWFEARGASRTVAIGALLAAGIGALGLFVVFLYPTIAHQAAAVSTGVPVLLDSIETQLIPWLRDTVGVDVPVSLQGAMSSYGDTIQAQIPSFTGFVTQALGQIWSQAGAVVASAVNLITIPIFIFYFLRDFDVMKASLVDYLPTADRDFILDRIQRVDAVVGMWFRGQCEVAAILGVLYAIGLAGVFGWAGVGVGAGVAVGLLAGLLNIIPYAGFVIGFGLAILLVLLEGAAIGPLIGVVAVFAVVQGLEGYVITPRIVGEKVGLSPVIVIIALLAGGELLGVVGVLVALPIAGAIRVLLPDVIAYWKASSVYTGRVDDLGPRGFIAIARAAESKAHGDEAPSAPASA